MTEVTETPKPWRLYYATKAGMRMSDHDTSDEALEAADAEKQAIQAGASTVRRISLYSCDPDAGIYLPDSCLYP